MTVRVPHRPSGVNHSWTIRDAAALQNVKFLLRTKHATRGRRPLLRPKPRRTRAHGVPPRGQRRHLPLRPTAGSETTDALKFLARLTTRIPDKGQVLHCYYGFSSSRQRGTRRTANGDGVEEPLAMVDPEPEASHKAKRRRALPKPAR